MKLVIDRNIWLRGEGTDVSRLLRPSDEKMCCVGIYLEQLGVPREELEDTLTPCYIKKDLMPEEAKWLLRPHTYVPGGLIDKIENSTVALDLYTTNDKRDISEEHRETSIKNLFAQNGVEVEFV